MNDLDKAYIIKLNKDSKIIKSSKLDWNIEEVNRFVALLKIQSIVGNILKTYDVDGAKLFDIEYLQIYLEDLLNETNYMSMYKLYFVVKAILDLTLTQQQKIAASLKSKSSKAHKKIGFATISAYKNIYIEQHIIKILKQNLQSIMNNTPIIQLSTTQLIKLLKNSNLQQWGQMCKKFNLDGFSLIWILSNETDIQSIRKYFTDQQMQRMVSLSDIFIHLYFYQHYHLKKQKQLKKQMQNSFNLLDDFNVQFSDINFKDVIQNIDNRSSLANSQYGVQEKIVSVRHSAYGVSQMGSIGKSAYGVSERCSIRNSLAQSMYGSSEIMDDQDAREISKKNIPGDVRISSIEDDTILKSLSLVTLQLPFNLLNLQPLQKIRIQALPYPFPYNKDKGIVKKQNKHQNVDNIFCDSSQKRQTIYNAIQFSQEQRQFKMFNLSGAKFGRNPQNDFSYPDQLSISGKHAQIVFKEQAYYIRDLGSKTGTFVYISDTKPLILCDEMYIQLSYQIQFKVKIIKSDVNEGIIKFQFKKPDNQPAYRAILKNKNIIRIGRSQNAHIRLTNQSISSKHAQIKYQQGKFILYGFNTPTGTWLRLSNKGVKSLDRQLTKYDIFRISSKKTFLVEDITDNISLHQNNQPQKKMVGMSDLLQ